MPPIKSHISYKFVKKETIFVVGIVAFTAPFKKQKLLSQEGFPVGNYFSLSGG